MMFQYEASLTDLSFALPDPFPRNRFVSLHSYGAVSPLNGCVPWSCPLMEAVNRKEFAMIFYAAVVLVMGMIGHGLYLAGVPSIMVQMSWILVLIGGLMSMVHVVTDF